jgi:hypothetical protein
MSATKRNGPRRAATAMRRCNLKKHNRIRWIPPRVACRCMARASSCRITNKQTHWFAMVAQKPAMSSTKFVHKRMFNPFLRRSWVPVFWGLTSMI